MTNSEKRQLNAEYVLSRFCDGNKAEMARELGVLQQTVTKWFTASPSNHRNIGDNAARRIELTFKLPRGWMDETHNPHDLEEDELKKLELKLRAGETYKIPLTHQVAVDPQLAVTFLAETKGLVMLLSTDEQVYALQLIGHNPDIWLTEGWAIIIEPNTPLAPNEFALLRLESGELLLRQIVHIKEDQLVVRNPVTREQRAIARSQISKSEYAYIGIPPSKIRLIDEATED
jgi:hypothetical protein